MGVRDAVPARPSTDLGAAASVAPPRFLVASPRLTTLHIIAATGRPVAIIRVVALLDALVPCMGPSSSGHARAPPGGAGTGRDTVPAMVRRGA